MYTCFKRAWWRKDNGKIVPNSGGRRTKLAAFNHEHEARDFCQQWNAENDLDWRSIKCEFTSDY